LTPGGRWAPGMRRVLSTGCDIRSTRILRRNHHASSSRAGARWSGKLRKLLPFGGKARARSRRSTHGLLRDDAVRDKFHRLLLLGGFRGRHGANRDGHGSGLLLRLLSWEGRYGRCEQNTGHELGRWERSEWGKVVGTSGFYPRIELSLWPAPRCLGLTLLPSGKPASAGSPGSEASHEGGEGSRPPGHGTTMPWGTARPLLCEGLSRLDHRQHNAGARRQ